MTKKPDADTSDTVPPAALATHTAPCPVATPIGPCPTATVFCCAPAEPAGGVTRVSRFVVPVTQSEPYPAAARTAPASTSIGAPAVPVRRSTGVSSCVANDVTHTSPPSTARLVGSARTGHAAFDRCRAAWPGSTSTTWLSTASATPQVPLGEHHCDRPSGQVHRVLLPARRRVEAHQLVAQVVGHPRGSALLGQRGDRWELEDRMRRQTRPAVVPEGLVRRRARPRRGAAAAA